MEKKLLLIALLLIACPLFALAANNNTNSGNTNLLYVDKNNNQKLDTDENLVVIAACDYKKIFKRKPPLERMLRSKVKNKEYIALTEGDFNNLDVKKDCVLDDKDKNHLYKIYFVKAKSLIRGAAITTKAKMVDYGDLKKIVLMCKHPHSKKSEAYFKDGDKINIRTSKQPTPSVGL